MNSTTPPTDDLDPLNRGGGVAPSDLPIRSLWLFDSIRDGPLFWEPDTLETFADSEGIAVWVNAPAPPAQVFYRKFARRYRWQVSALQQTVTLLEEWFYNPEFAQWRPARLFDETLVTCPVIANTLGAKLLLVVPSFSST